MNGHDDGEVRDELPEDLNATEYVGPYVFPNNNRRRIAATLYVIIGLVFVVLWLVANDSPMVNAGFGWGGIVLIAIIGFVVFGQRLDAPALIGIAMIVAGIVVINLFSNSTHH